MWSTDNLNPLHFDTFEEFLKTKKRFEDVDDIFDKHLDEEKEKKEMEKLWFTRYDEPLSKHEEFFVDFQLIQDITFDKDFFHNKLLNSDKIFPDNDYENPPKETEIPQTWMKKASKENKIFQLLKIFDKRYFMSDVCIANKADKKEVKLFGIAIWMFCISKIKWRFLDRKYTQKIQDFLENTVFQSKDLVKLKKLFIKISQSK